MQPPPPPALAAGGEAAAGVGGPTGFVFPPPAPGDEAIDASPIVGPLERLTPSPKVLKVALVGLAVVLAGLFVWFKVLNGPPSAPDEAAVASVIVPVEGFEYETAPAAATEFLEGFMKAIPDLGEHVGAVGGRVVKQGARPVGVILVIGVQPDALRDMDRGGFKMGLDAVSPAGVVERQRRGVQMFEAQMGQLYSVMFTDDDGYIFSVQAQGQKTAVKLAKKLAAANL